MQSFGGGGGLQYKCTLYNYCPHSWVQENPVVAVEIPFNSGLNVL